MTAATAAHVASGTRDEPLSGRLARGAVGGLVAGLVFIAITMWFADTLGDPADAPLMMISTLVKGDAAMETGAASASVGWIVHAALSIFFGIVFALVTPLLRTNGTAAIAGAVYGALLYVVNFLVLAPLAFPVMEMANQPFELVVHVVFGLLVALAFYGWGVRGNEPAFALTRARSGARA